MDRCNRRPFGGAVDMRFRERGFPKQLQWLHKLYHSGLEADTNLIGSYGRDNFYRLLSPEMQANAFEMFMESPRPSTPCMRTDLWQSIINVAIGL